MDRSAKVERATTETRIAIRLGLDGSGTASVSTGLPFMDHMLTAWARHGRFDLEIEAGGDLEVDAHHTLEDLGLVLGQALREALGDKSGIARFGAALIPMDDALVRVVLDCSGRPWLRYHVQPDTREVGGFHVRLFREFFQALVNAGGLTLHIDLLAGAEVHHIFEALFKAFGRALGQATGLDPNQAGIPSTKGVLA